MKALQAVTLEVIYCLPDEFCHETVEQLRQQIGTYMEGKEDLLIDVKITLNFRHVRSMDVSALSYLQQVCKNLKQIGNHLEFHQVPQDIQAILDTAGLLSELSPQYTSYY